MSEKEFLMDILETEKCMSVNMTYALNEASSKYLYDIYFGMFKDINKSAKDIFTALYDKGCYKLEEETIEKIKQTYNTLLKEIE